MNSVLTILGFALLYVVAFNFLDFLLRKARLTNLPDWMYFVLNFIIPFAVLLWHFQLRWWLAALLAFLIMIVCFIPEVIWLSLMKKKQESYKGPQCLMCGREIYPQDTILQTQALYVQAGKSAQARDIEKQAGYQCIQCSAQYCKNCLETRASVGPSGGRLCPNCGGAFQYMPRTLY